MSFNFKLWLNEKELKQEFCIKYLGIYIESNLSRKGHRNYIAKKNQKKYWDPLQITLLYISEKILTNLYHALIYPFLISGITI